MDNITDNRKERIDALKKIDIRTVDQSTLVDIKDIKINLDLPKEERILDYIEQIKNPYCYKCGDVIIKISFADTEYTLQDKIESYLKSL